MLVKVVYADVQNVTHLRPIKGRNRLGLVRALIGTLRSSLIGLALDPLVCLWQSLFVATSLRASPPIGGVWRGNDGAVRLPGAGDMEPKQPGLCARSLSLCTSRH